MRLSSHCTRPVAATRLFHPVLFLLMKAFLLLPALLLLSPWRALHAQQHTVSGYVKDARTGETLPGANVYDQGIKKGTAANAYGFYSLTLPGDTARLVYSYVGYGPVAHTLRLDRDLTLAVELTSATTLDEVVVSAPARIEETTQMSAVTIPVEQIKTLPAFFGEVDVLKVIQLMPGVQSGAEETTGFYVRGGSPDQNLILLDGVPLYYVSHLGGLFSIFNADAISHVSLVKGGFPARYGGRLSSVLDIGMKEGNMKKFHGEGSLGFIAPKLSLEGPIVKDRTSFMVSARRTFADLFMRPISRAASGNKNAFGYYFYDFNGKVNHIVSGRDRLYLSFYAGQDRYAARLRNEYYKTDSTAQPEADTLVRNQSNIRVAWGNVLAALRWNHVFGKKLFGNATLHYTRYRLSVGARSDASQSLAGEAVTQSRTDFTSRSGIEDLSGRMDFEWYPAPAHSIRFGVGGIRHRFTPGITTFRERAAGDQADTTIASYTVGAWEGSLYAEDDWEITPKLKINAGVHLSGFYVNSTFYPSVQPRLAARYRLGNGYAVKASYAAMQQFIHLLTNSNAGLPTDLWVPATDRIAPQRSRQGAVGVARSFGGNAYELSVEAYYKDLSGLIEYKEGTNFLTSADRWEESVETGGRGWARGLEVLVQRKTGRLTGWVGYTWSRTDRQFANINFGNRYPFKYDRRHDLSLVASYKAGKKVTLSGDWVYGTGNAVTLPTAQYHLDGASPGNPFNRTIHVYNGRNQFRMRPSHRLDVNLSFSKQTRWGERSWNFGAYNLYSRRNPYLYYISGNPFVARQVRQVSLFPIIPYFSYHFKF